MAGRLRQADGGWNFLNRGLRSHEGKPERRPRARHQVGEADERMTCGKNGWFNLFQYPA